MGGSVPAALRWAAFRLLLAGTRASGAAFIKWGQWATTRGDLFPPDLCRVSAGGWDARTCQLCGMGGGGGDLTARGRGLRGRGFEAFRGRVDEVKCCAVLAASAIVACASKDGFECLLQVLGELHDAAPRHAFSHTRREVEAAFGAPLEDAFVSFEREALASGSVAQVHRAILRVTPRQQQQQQQRFSRSFGAGEGRGAVALTGRPKDEGGRLVDGEREVEVVVKVRHPGVAERIRRDFQLLQPLAALSWHVRSLRVGVGWGGEWKGWVAFLGGAYKGSCKLR